MASLLNGSESKLSHPAHPYYPLGVEVAGYLANSYSVPFLLGTFAVGCVVIFATVYTLIKRFHPSLPQSQIWATMWFVLTGTIHLFFEGYYSMNQANMGGLQTLFGQMWKEYALSDSRYLTQDAFVLCMESLTAFVWGPLSYCVAIMIVADHPLRHPLQAMVSMGQIYGDILYYATSLYDLYILDIKYSRPEAYYYWCYYFMLNFFWIVIPGILLYNSVYATGKAFEIAASVTKGKKTK